MARIMKIQVHTPTYQEARYRYCKSLSSLTGRGGNFLASLDGPEEFIHLSHFTFCEGLTFVEAIIWSFSRINSVTKYKVQCLIYPHKNSPLRSKTKPCNAHTIGWGNKIPYLQKPIPSKGKIGNSHNLRKLLVQLVRRVPNGGLHSVCNSILGDIFRGSILAVVPNSSINSRGYVLLLGYNNIRRLN